ncbi:hypothetical protein INT46_011454 [Mucor plumbeus]|uniref:BZIP domain-containing protein n=1 Tax=Mucor plumbeus TaxID=97098 RepID=A0A8H7RG66_9FUNG|nr:hypothetical protein INT46_011454 [Mucor plumbeus]
MKKTSDAIVIYHQDDSDQNSEDECRSSPNISNEVEKALNQSNSPKSPPTPQPIKLTSKGAIQLTSSSTSSNATTNAILNLKINPFFHDKRKWDDSFTVAEKKELTGNIVKAARDNDGETYVTLQEEEYTIPNSTLEDEEDESQESDDIDSSNKKPGRKPMADEDSLSDPDQDPKVKRKAQNRAAQRAFRERKERYVKELEIKIKQVQDAHLIATAQLVRENQQLRNIIYRLESENYALKGIPMQPYQSQAPPPVHQAPRTTSNANNPNSNYANIAPLLPQTPNQQPMLLPAYLSNSPSSSPISSILHPTSSSVNQMMMLASSPLQQYPMSPVVSAALQNAASPTPSTKSISKKVSSKHHKSTPTPPPNNQPLEYTFSISTPASLRPNGGSSNSSSSKHNRSEPVELVQLYPPGGNHQTKNSGNSTGSPSSTSSSLKKSDLIMLSPGYNQSSSNNNNTSKKAASVTSVSSNGSHSNATVPLMTANTPSSLGNGYHDDASSIMSDKTSSTVNTQQQRKKIQQLEIDMFDCHIDTEGQFFCEKLHNEVCNDAFDRLLSEPLFDQMGKLNLSISSYPVPIVTGPMSFEEQQRKKNNNNRNRNQQENSNDDKGGEKESATEKKDVDSTHDAGESSLSPSSSAAATIAATTEAASTQTPTSTKSTNNSSPNTTTTTNTTNTDTIITTNTTNPTTTTTTITQQNQQNQQNQSRLLTCPEIWFILNQHENFSHFTTDQLCQAVKELAKCADSGPVLEEHDLFEILAKMDQDYL